MDGAIAEASRCWDERLNCAESVLRGVCHAKGVELPATAKKMATPFGGGVGRSEDLCGALAGGVMALGACLGRVSPDEDKLRSYSAAGKLFKLFGDTLGSTKCAVLNKGDFKSPEHRIRCGRIVAESARITMEVLDGTR